MVISLLHMRVLVIKRSEFLFQFIICRERGVWRVLRETESDRDGPSRMRVRARIKCA